MQLEEMGLRSGIIELDGSVATKYKVTFKLNNEIIPENRTRVELAMEEEVSLPVSASVVSHRLKVQKGKTQPRTLYKIHVKTSTGEEYYIERRFSEFDALNHLVRSQTSGHLKPSLPKMPSKVYNPWTDQSSDPFIQQRKGKLQLYVGTLLGNKKIVHYQDVLYFFGLDYLGRSLSESNDSESERYSERPTEAVLSVHDCVAVAPILSASQGGVHEGARESAEGLISPSYSDDEEEYDAKPSVAIPPHIIQKEEDVALPPPPAPLSAPPVDSTESPLENKATEASQDVNDYREEFSSSNSSSSNSNSNSNGSSSSSSSSNSNSNSTANDANDQVPNIDIEGVSDESSKKEIEIKDNDPTVNSFSTPMDLDSITPPPLPPPPAAANDVTTNGQPNENELEAVDF